MQRAVLQCCSALVTPRCSLLDPLLLPRDTKGITEQAWSCNLYTQLEMHGILFTKLTTPSIVYATLMIWVTAFNAIISHSSTHNDSEQNKYPPSVQWSPHYPCCWVTAVGSCSGHYPPISAQHSTASDDSILLFQGLSLIEMFLPRADDLDLPHIFILLLYQCTLTHDHNWWCN